MDPALRRVFNANYSDSLYRDLIRRLESETKCKIAFRVAETPVFLPAGFRAKAERAANEIVAQRSDPKKIAAMSRDLPARYDTPRRSGLPEIGIVDFAVTRAPSGELEPKLIELQGFPSLFGLTFTHARVWGELCAAMPGMPQKWSSFFSGLTSEGFVDLFRRSVLGSHRPDDVVLADLKPLEQKTNVDFFATQQILGIDPVCPSTFLREGNQLFRMKNGRRVPIRRIYHRVVF